MNSSLQQRLEQLFQARIIQVTSVSGGCIANASSLTLENDSCYFLKHGEGLEGSFLCEANGLKAMAHTNTIRIPNVMFVEEDFLVLEWINSNTRCPDFMKQLGQELAQMHRSHSDSFGWQEDNFIGASPQYNGSHQPNTNWCAFYWSYRLQPQLAFAQKKGYATNELQRLMERLSEKLEELLKGSEEPPCLIHGDLWSGNVMADEQGEPCLIDPAIHYGHREAELAMTHLFGGFGQDFYDAYQKEYPLKPGYEERMDLYKLYHVLNHLNLFGQSYYEQTIRILKQYT